MMDEIAILLGMIEDAAPEMWRIAMRQVAIDINVCAAWIIVFGGLAIITACLSGGEFRKRKGDEGFGWAAASLLAAILTLGIAGELYAMVVNPEYRAIELLSKIVRGD